MFSDPTISKLSLYLQIMNQTITQVGLKGVTLAYPSNSYYLLDLPATGYIINLDAIEYVSFSDKGYFINFCDDYALRVEKHDKQKIAEIFSAHSCPPGFLHIDSIKTVFNIKHIQAISISEGGGAIVSMFNENHEISRNEYEKIRELFFTKELKEHPPTLSQL